MFEEGNKAGETNIESKHSIIRHRQTSLGFDGLTAR
jgi:hypothetical protein